MDFLNWNKKTILYYTLKNCQENRSHVNYSYNNKKTKKEAQKTYRGDGYSFYLNYGYGFTGVCICSNSSNVIH